MIRTPYDAIVVGARCAGAPKAMLLARAGARVLLVDRARFPSDTISSHMIRQPGVTYLQRWGLLDAVLATGCPPIHKRTISVGDRVIPAPEPAPDSLPVVGPRRAILDVTLLQAAAAAGVDVREVARTWTGTTWFIEGDIAGCYDRLDHQVMLDALGETIHDNRMLSLVSNMLAAGYLEDWVWNPTLSGVPQGGVASPILSNIYLHRLDMFVEKVLLPEYNRGERRKHSPAYRQVHGELTKAHRRGDTAAVRSLRRKLRSPPTLDPYDPDYRRLRYVRYADDTLLGFAGPKAEAEEIKRHLSQFLQDKLKLELNQEKTLITHARTQRARFLGYEIITQHADRFVARGRRSTNGGIGLKVPKAVIKAKCAKYMCHGKPVRRPELTNFDDHVIIASYGAEYRGIVQYYLMAGDVARLTRLNWVMVTSMLKTLAGKYDSSVSKMARKYKATTETPYGPRRCFQVSVERGEGKKPLVARFGGIPLRRQKNAVLTDRVQALSQGRPSTGCTGSSRKNATSSFRLARSKLRPSRSRTSVWLTSSTRAVCRST